MYARNFINRIHTFSGVLHTEGGNRHVAAGTWVSDSPASVGSSFQKRQVSQLTAE